MTTKSRKTNTPSAKTKTKSAAAPASRRSRKPAAAAGGNTSRQRVEEEIADRIIELLDKGELPPWEKGWRNSQTGHPVNALTMKPYRGINRWLTLITQQSMGYDDPRWLTYRQAEALGGHVQKGEKSTTVIFWKRVPFRQREDGDETQNQAPANNGSNGSPPDESRIRTYPMLRSYRVFNLEQTQDCKVKPLPPAETTSHDPIELAEAIIAGMPNPPGDGILRERQLRSPLPAGHRRDPRPQDGPLPEPGGLLQHRLPRVDPRHRALQAAGPLQPRRQRRRPPRLRPGGADRRDGLRHAGRPRRHRGGTRRAGRQLHPPLAGHDQRRQAHDHTLRLAGPEGR